MFIVEESRRISLSTLRRRMSGKQCSLNQWTDCGMRLCDNETAL